MAEFKTNRGNLNFYNYMVVSHCVYKTTSNKKQAYNNGHHFHSRLLLVFEKISMIEAELFR